MARGWSATKVFRDHHAKLKWGPESTALYGDMERDKRPGTPEERDYFLRLYAPAVPDPEPEPVVQADQSALIAALAAHTAALMNDSTGQTAHTESPVESLATALSEIATELRLAREERAETKARLDEMEEALKVLYGRASADGASDEPARQGHSRGNG